MDRHALNGNHAPAAVSLESAPERAVGTEEEAQEAGTPVAAQEAPPEPAPAPPAPPEEAFDDIQRFYRDASRPDKDVQADAALVFAYYLQVRQGFPFVALSDLLRCCIHAGVDSRNFHRALGALTRRGLFAPRPDGHSYLLTDQGIQSVEERLS